MIDIFVPFALIWMAVCGGALLWIVVVVIRGLERRIDLLEDQISELRRWISKLEV